MQEVEEIEEGERGGRQNPPALFHRGGIGVTNSLKYSYLQM